MVYKKLELKNYFEFLGENGANPTLELFLPYNMSEMGRENQKRPCILVCPGGGYGMCSQRAAEPIAKPLPVAAVVLPRESRASVRSLTFASRFAI